ncbi:hypothetical protein ACQPW3_22935 [Actinosynnema sp. CA-248983]
MARGALLLIGPWSDAGTTTTVRCAGAHGDRPQDIAEPAASSDRIVDRLFCQR